MNPLPTHLTPAAALLAVVGLIGGCASPKEAVIFTTKTSTAVADVDTTPSTFSIGYDRIEGYAGPRFANGQVFPVASSIESKGEGLSREVRQVFVTGKAAEIATDQKKTSGTANTNTNANNSNTNTDASTNANGNGNGNGNGNDDRKVVFFGTATNIGLKLGFAEASLIPNSATLGYKRKEVAIVPVESARDRTSVLGSIGTTIKAVKPGDQQTTGEFVVEQYFATGTVADQLAELASVKERFRDNATRAMGNVEAYRLVESEQKGIALKLVSCVYRVPNDKLGGVWDNADALGVFDQYNLIPRIRANNDPAQQRQLYFEMLSIIPANADRAVLLQMHLKRVLNFCPTAS